MVEPRRRRWIPLLLILLAGWLVAAVWLVPWLIRDAYSQESIGPLNRILAGRDVHPVEFYLHTWTRLAWRLTLAMILAAGSTWLAVRWLPQLLRLPPARLASRTIRGSLVALLAVSVLWAVASVWFPFGWDHGIMAAVGDVIVRGGMPYADGWDMKGPLPYYVFAFLQWAFGPQVWGVRVLDLALAVGASVALGKMVGRITTPGAVPWVGLALFLWYASLGYFFTAQPDGWVAMGVTLCFAPLVGRARPSTLGNVVWCGLVVGLGALVKPLFAAFLVIPALHVTLTRGESRRHTLGRGLALAGAFIVPVALTLGWFASRGALDDLLRVHVGYTATSYARVGSLQLGDRIAGTLAFVWSEEIAVVLPILLLGIYAAWSFGRPAALLLWSWLCVTLLVVILQGKFYEYHWIPMYPPLVALTGLGLFALFATSTGSGIRSHVPNVARTLAVLAIIVGFARVAYAPTLTIARFTPFALGRVDADRYYGQFGLRGAPYSPGDERLAARYIRSRTEPTEGVVVFGTNGGIHYLSRRAAPTRFVFSLPLMRATGVTRDAYREEFLGDLRRAPPTYIVVGMTIDGGAKEASLAGFPEFAELLRETYTLEIRIGHLDVYRRAT